MAETITTAYASSASPAKVEEGGPLVENTKDPVPKQTICIVLGGHFSAQIGGAQYQAKCIVEGLRESKKFNISFLARAINPDYTPKGYAVIQIAKPIGLRKYSFAFDTAKLLKLLGQIKPDVIYQRCLNAHTGIIAYYAKKSGCRSVFHIAHDDDLLPLRIEGRSRLKWLRVLEKRMGEYGLRNVDSIVAQTAYQARLLEQHYGRKATAVIPNFQPVPNEDLAKGSKQVRIIWVANFKRMKQPEVFVQLAKELTYRDDLRFVMIGRAGAKEQYTELHDDIGNLPNLTYLGELSIDEVNMQLAEGHIFVNTSRAEGFPNTFIQAWMRKVPTLSLVVDPDGLLSSGRIGFCGCGSYELLRDKIVELADNSETRERMGEAAQQYALQEHSPKAIRRLIDVLQGTAKPGND